MLLFSLLTLLFFSVNEGNVGRLLKRLEPGQIFEIESSWPYLCIYFLKLYKIQMEIFVNGNSYKIINDTSTIAGIDFGASIGKIVFRPIENSQNIKQLGSSYDDSQENKSDDQPIVLFSYLVFPRVCTNHRYISTLPNLNFTFLRYNYTSEDYRLTSNQQFCFWPAAPAEHLITVTTDTEPNFDNIKVFTENGLVLVLSGYGKKDVFSKKGMEYFIWESDATRTSKMFAFNISTYENKQYPIVNQILRGYQASDVTMFFVQENYDKTFKKKNDLNDRMKTFVIPALVLITVCLIISTILTVVWAFHVYKTVAEYGIEHAMHESSNNDFIHASSDEFPLPYTIESQKSKNSL